MNQPPETPPRPGSFIPLVLAFILAGLVIAALSVLTLGFVGMVVAIVFGMAAFIALQYLIWGWWLGQAIRDDFEAEEQERDEM